MCIRSRRLEAVRVVPLHAGVEVQHAAPGVARAAFQLVQQGRADAGARAEGRSSFRLMFSVRTARALIAVYVGLIVAATALVVYSELVRDDGDGLSAVFLIVLSLPLGILALLTPVEGLGALVLLTAAALLQAGGLWLLTSRVVARRRSVPPAPV